MFYYYLLFQLTNEIYSFIETNYCDHNFIHIIKKLSCVSRLLRSSRRRVTDFCAHKTRACKLHAGLAAKQRSGVTDIWPLNYPTWKSVKLNMYPVDHESREN